MHRIFTTHISVSLQFQNDRTVSFDSLEALQKFDLKTEALTDLVTLKWSFVFDAEGLGQEHLHSIYVRISERPNPGLLLQRVLSSHNEDLDSIDNGALSPITCKIDFFDSRFSGEILSVVTEWVRSLPKAEPTFGLINWLSKYDDRITAFVYGTLPAISVLGYIGLWLGFLPAEMTNSARTAAAWALGGGVVFLFTRYVASRLNNIFNLQLKRICMIPVFQITAGDNNRVTKYLARSHKSMFKLAGTGLVYGVFKAAGIYLATYVLRAFGT